MKKPREAGRVTPSLNVFVYIMKRKVKMISQNIKRSFWKKSAIKKLWQSLVNGRAESLLCMANFLQISQRKKIRSRIGLEIDVIVESVRQYSMRYR